MTTEQVPSKELAYRDALARIRQVCRSDAKDFEAATIERRQVYDIANMTLDAHGDLYASGHEPFVHPYGQHPHQVCACGAKVPTDVHLLHTCGDRLTPKGFGPAAEQPAANSGQCVSREAAQSGTTAGSSQPPPDVRSMRVLLEDAERIVSDFARNNPRWKDTTGLTQDPWGAHAWLERYSGLTKGEG